MSKLVYVAGPFRGANAWEVEQNIRRAEVLGFHVAALGGIPVIPHTMYRFWDGTLTDEFWLRSGWELLRKCDGIILTVKWKNSAGTCAEVSEAQACGLSIWYEEQVFLGNLVVAEFRHWLDP